MTSQLATESAVRSRSSTGTAGTPGLGGLDQTLRWFPILAVAVFSVLIITPSTRPIGLWLLEENHPVELLTFASLLGAAVMAVRLGMSLERTSQSGLHRAFFLLFGAGLFVVAMEEVAWGQWFLHYGTPEIVRAVNQQGEMTLHNIGALQGRSEFFRIAFGLGVFAGCFAGWFPAFRRLAVPPVLWSWVAVILGVSAIDLVTDYVTVPYRLDHLLQRLSEVIELLIGLTALIHVQVCTRRFLPETKSASAQGGAK